jgi:glutaminyl-peptide cyclotransferase
MKILFFLLCILLSCCTPAKKENASTQLDIEYLNIQTVDGEAALELVKSQLAFGPRHVNSEGAKKCAAFIAKFAEELGFNVKVDIWTEGSGEDSRVFRNIICTKTGQGSQFVLAGSHYDTKILTDHPKFTGANDGASSTALLMQVMKEITQSKKWNHHCSMRFVFFDGEEAFHMYTSKDGLNGSRRYASQIYKNGESRSCRGMILMDMIGDKDFKLTIPSNSTKDLIDKTEAIAKHLGYEKHFSVLEADSFHDDHKPYLQIGIPAIDLIDFEYGIKTKENGGGSFWHTSEDTIDKLSADSLTKCGMIFKHLLWQLSNNPIIKKK